MKKKNLFKTCAIIVAAGTGSRMGMEINKVYLEVMDKPILAYTIEAFENCESIDEIIIVTGEKDIFLANDIVKTFNLRKVKAIVAGGETRDVSVKNGLTQLSGGIQYVAIHDGARPLISCENIAEAVKTCYEYKAVTVAVPVKDTIKIVDDNQFSVETPLRSHLWAVQTPQVFEKNLIVQAHVDCKINCTDDATMVENIGDKVKIVMGSYENIKITTLEDVFLMEMIVSQGKK